MEKIKNKKSMYVGMCLTFLFNLGFVSAVSKAGTSFDLVYLLVENLFGNILFAVVGMGVILLFIGMISKMSSTLLSTLILLYGVTMMAGYVGALVAVPMLVFSLIYFMFNLGKFLRYVF